jgi:cysteine desulfurase
MANARLVYADYAATTPVDPIVIDAMLPYLSRDFGNPASTHSFGRRAFDAVARARDAVATLVGATSQEIVFTSGATESINLALKSAMALAPPSRRHVITVATEHKAVLDTVRALTESDVRVTVLPVDQSGRVALSAIRDAIADDSWLISVMAANNETGTLGPLAEVSAVARETGLMVHTDATQAVGKIPLDVRDPAVDLMSFSAHKLYGPKGVGALFVRRELHNKLAPQIHGGGHERGMRSGTLNVPGIVGFGEAARLATSLGASDEVTSAGLRDRLEARLLRAFPSGKVNGSLRSRLPNISNIWLPGIDADSLILAMPDVAVSSGSACTSASPTPSHVLLAMGVPYKAAAESVRFSIGRFTTENDVDYVAARVQDVGRRLLGTQSPALAG